MTSRAEPQAAPPPATARTHSANTPVSRPEEAWAQRNASMNARVKQGDIDLLFIGDSITQGWEDAGKETWAKFYGKRKAVNLGISGDRTQHVLWRLQNGNLLGLGPTTAPGTTRPAGPRLAVIMIGTNNSNASDNTAREIADGIIAIVTELRKQLPQTKVLLLAIFPRNEKPDDAQRAKCAEASRLASAIADGKMVHFVDISAKLLEADGTLSREVMPDLLHLSRKGYSLWAEAIEPRVKELLGE